ncbi:MAG: MFS transporter, partial [Pelagibacteraceae bacterium]
ASCFMVLAAMGVRQTYGMFFNFFESDLGVSRTHFGLAIAIQAITWGIMTFFLGILADKFGARRVSCFALIIYAFGIYALTLPSSTGLMFLLNLGVLVGIGMGGGGAQLAVGAVSKHFPNENRSKASGLVTAFGSLGMFIFPLISAFSLNQTTWQNTYLILVFVLIVAAGFSLLIKLPDDADIKYVKSEIQGALSALKVACAHRGYIFLTLGFFVCGFQITLVATHVPGYVVERGLEAWTGTAILSLIGLFNIAGTLTMGYLADKYSKKLLLSGLYFLRGITIILFLALPASSGLAIAFGVCFGFLWLATIPATNGIVAQIFGTKHITMLFGLVFFSHQIGAFLGAYLGGYFFDQYGSYDNAWYLSIALSLFATVMHLPIDERPLKRLSVT